MQCILAAPTLFYIYIPLSSFFYTFLNAYIPCFRCITSFLIISLPFWHYNFLYDHLSFLSKYLFLGLYVFLFNYYHYSLTVYHTFHLYPFLSIYVPFFLSTYLSFWLYTFLFDLMTFFFSWLYTFFSNYMYLSLLAVYLPFWL